VQQSIAPRRGFSILSVSFFSWAGKLEQACAYSDPHLCCSCSLFANLAVVFTRAMKQRVWKEEVIIVVVAVVVVLDMKFKVGGEIP
jgi:hypothetical protein